MTRIEQLASNSTMYYRGDECMEIAPFDNYYMFTLFRESDDGQPDDSVPLDLTNTGSLFLSFADGDNTVRVENYREAENIDAANGEVVFRIGKEDARRILSFSSRTFYVSAMMTDGRTSSDETVLYSGEWVEFSKGMKGSLTDTITSLKNTVLELQAKLQDAVDSYEAKLASAQSEIESLKADVESRDATIRKLQDTIDAYNSDIVDYIEANIIGQRDGEHGTTEGSGRLPGKTAGGAPDIASRTTAAVEASAARLERAWMANAGGGAPGAEEMAANAATRLARGN